MKPMNAKLAFEGIKNLLGGVPSHKLDDLLECLILLEQDSYNRGIKSVIDKLLIDYAE